jgi:quercetin dioxygenase-like cupin family protein
VLEGVGRCQRASGPVEEIRPGGRVFFEPGEHHWHGAALDRFMLHVAIAPVDDQGSPVTWGVHVTDAEHTGADQEPPQV